MQCSASEDHDCWSSQFLLSLHGFVIEDTSSPSLHVLDADRTDARGGRSRTSPTRCKTSLDSPFLMNRTED